MFLTREYVFAAFRQNRIAAFGEQEVVAGAGYIRKPSPRDTEFDARFHGVDCDAVHLMQFAGVESKARIFQVDNVADFECTEL